MIKELLKESKQNKKIINIWNYDDDDSFWSGYVEEYNDELVYIKHYTKYGKPDGIVIERIENIKTIDFDNNYTRLMEYLIDNHDQLEIENSEIIQNPKTDNWKFEIIKPLVGDPNTILRIIMDDDDAFVGLVSKVDESHIMLNCIDSEGTNEFFTIYKLDDIKSIRINDLDSRKRLLLFKWKYGL